MSANTAGLNWGAEALWLALEPLLPGLSVEVVAQVDSTNTALLARARQSPADALVPSLLVAERQTAGRGRQGKAWQSAAGASLTFSLALPLALSDWSGLSLAVGLALADALDPTLAGAPHRLGLKWPNDLIVLDTPGQAPHLGRDHIGRKLGGILIETVQAGTQRIAVVGIGLNIHPPAPSQVMDTSAPHLAWGLASVQELQPGLDAPATLAQLALPLVQALQAFERQGFAPLQPAFAQRDVLAGRNVTTSLPGLTGVNGVTGLLAGRADGVDSTGTLWLHTPDGRRPVASGDVSLQATSATPC